jgi:hypothetical protein
MEHAIIGQFERQAQPVVSIAHRNKEFFRLQLALNVHDAQHNKAKQRLAGPGHEQGSKPVCWKPTP